VAKIVENLWVVGAPPNPTGEVDNAPPELQVTSLKDHSLPSTKGMSE